MGITTGNTTGIALSGIECGRHSRHLSPGLMVVAQHCDTLLNSDARLWHVGRLTPRVFGCIADGGNLRDAGAESITDPGGSKSSSVT